MDREGRGTAAVWLYTRNIVYDDARSLHSEVGVSMLVNNLVLTDYIRFAPDGAQLLGTFQALL
jgi:hypothetical protein